MNGRVLTVIVCVMAVTNIASADIVRGINLDFVTIGNAGNPADTTGYGAVGYEYRIGKYEITNAQWNQLADAPTGTDCGYGGSATYTGDQQPANSISWYEALQFCNYLTSGDKSQGVYQFTGNSADPGGFIGIDTDTTAIATYGTVYRLPTEDEWYKAAYHKNDGVTGNYWLYPTQSDSVPSNDLIDPDPGNNANFWQDGGYTIGSPDYLTNVGDFENSDSAYGTFDQAGNVWEWNEALIGSYRGVRSGAVGIDESHFASSSARYSTFGPCYADGTIGFRVASVPEPAEPAEGRIAFVSDRDGNEEIYLMNVDGSNQISLTNDPGVDASPVFSPDGGIIAFISNRSGSHRIYTMSFNGSELREVPNSECFLGYTNYCRSLAWSPDGQKLLFEPTSDSLATINLDGSGKTILFTGGVDGHNVIWGPEWGPTMDDIYFNAQPSSNGYDQHIFRYSISGNNLTQITMDVQPTCSMGAKVSSDGSRIVFFRQEQWEAGYNIFTMDLDGGNMSKITHDNSTSNSTPDWAGETREIVFWSNKSGRAQIWLMDSTGGNLRMLEGEGNNYAPSWTPAPTEPEWSFVHITDTHIGYKYKKKKDKDKATDDLDAAISQIVNMSIKPEFILFTGDIAHYGCDENSNCHGHYNRFLESIQNAVAAGIKVYVVPGNHDWSKPDLDTDCENGLACYNQTINPARPAGAESLYGLNNYYFYSKYNDILFIGLDTGGYIGGLSEDQISALRGLGAVDRMIPKVVFMHHPGVDVDDGWPDEDFSIREGKPEFLDWCDSNNVQLVLAGHSHQKHVYDRNGDDVPVNSMTYPQFIQTPTTNSHRRWPGVLEGYRIVQVLNDKTYPQEYTPTRYRNVITTSLSSPGNLHVYDSAGRHVGVVDGNEAERGIPDSFYHSHYVVSTEDGNEVFPEKVIIFDPCDDYLYEVLGTETGAYLLQISSTEDGNEITFEANDIPTLPGSVHHYVIDWDVLSEGGEGVVIAVDADGDGDFERTITADNELTLEEFDTEPPTINSISASPDVLWPVNHKMVAVTVTVDAEDICDPAPVCKIVNVTSNEPINGLGDGNGEPDWEITGDLTVNLRAERGGSADGRVYTIHVECEDAAGNIATASVDVTVPHDQGKGKKKGR